MAHSSGGMFNHQPARPARRPPEECAMARGLRKAERLHEHAPIALGELIHAQAAVLSQQTAVPA
jgi:hypothetical protein